MKYTKYLLLLLVLASCASKRSISHRSLQADVRPVAPVEVQQPVVVVEEEEPVPVVEEVEPEAPPPAGTRQDSLNGRIYHLIFYVYYLSCLRQTFQSSISFFNI